MFAQFDIGMMSNFAQEPTGECWGVGGAEKKQVVYSVDGQQQQQHQ